MLLHPLQFIVAAIPSSHFPNLPTVSALAEVLHILTLTLLVSYRINPGGAGAMVFESSHGFHKGTGVYTAIGSKDEEPMRKKVTWIG